MAINNNAVTISGGLACSTLNTPGIGVNTQSAALAYTDGDMAIDKYVNVATTPTALNASLAGDGYVFVSNPGPAEVSLLVGSTALGKLQAGVGVPIPCATGVIINATVASGTQNVGVTAIKVSANE